MAAYGTVRTIAEQLGLTEAIELLQQTEDEEKKADGKLTEIAMALYGSLPNCEADVAEEEDEVETVSAGASRPRNGSKRSK